MTFDQKTADRDRSLYGDAFGISTLQRISARDSYCDSQFARFTNRIDLLNCVFLHIVKFTTNFNPESMPLPLPKLRICGVDQKVNSKWSSNSKKQKLLTIAWPFGEKWQIVFTRHCLVDNVASCDKRNVRFCSYWKSARKRDILAQNWKFQIGILLLCRAYHSNSSTPLTSSMKILHILATSCAISLNSIAVKILWHWKSRLILQNVHQILFSKEVRGTERFTSELNVVESTPLPNGLEMHTIPMVRLNKEVKS